MYVNSPKVWYFWKAENKKENSKKKKKAEFVSTSIWSQKKSHFFIFWLLTNKTLLIKIDKTMPFSQIVPLSPSPTESKRLFYTSVSLLLSGIQCYGVSLVAQRLKHLPLMQETWVRSLGREDPLEKEVAIHASILAWRIPWMEEPGRLQSMGWQRVGNDWAT